MKHAFQAEVRQVLDIVINSLYTDREIFLRELVSNASDALEKLKHAELTHTGEIFDGEAPRQVSITTDSEAKTITIADSGIGMTREELVQNLGTIAHSGSRAFLQSLGEADSAKGNVIGKFGVGFYSVFMVAKRVQVFTHSWRPEGEHLCWTSDGDGGYEIEEVPGQARGCKIVIELKDDQAAFAEKWKVSSILEKYSNFVSFPILLDGERVNTVEPLWLKSKSSITPEQYSEFYNFIGHAGGDPRYTFHFQSDTPLNINALVFVPEDNPERFYTGQTAPGVALYCRRVLIDSQPKGLLPDYLRFLKGVIDSDDLPLNISRETMQDSALVRKLGDVITKRFLKFLDEESTQTPEKYTEFYIQFQRFLKEGVATDYAHKDQLAKLLRFESSLTEKGKLTSLADYLTRAREGQKEIYYQVAPSRESIEAGPYLEGFRSRNLEVLYLLEPIDQYLVDTLREFDGKKLISVDSAEVELEEQAQQGTSLSEAETEALAQWLKEVYADRVEGVRAGKRLVDSPAAALTPDGGMNPQMRAMMRAMNQEVPEQRVVLEINPRHALIQKLATARSSNAATAEQVARQLLDNALISAGLVEDPREMVNRLYDLMGAALK